MAEPKARVLVVGEDDEAGGLSHAPGVIEAQVGAAIAEGAHPATLVALGVEDHEAGRPAARALTHLPLDDRVRGRRQGAPQSRSIRQSNRPAQQDAFRLLRCRRRQDRPDGLAASLALLGQGLDSGRLVRTARRFPHISGRSRRSGDAQRRPLPARTRPHARRLSRPGHLRVTTINRPMSPRRGP